ncbi:MAG TPA: hypothetical protein VLB27_00705, partial [candidate division Zixibacteria bacterium]|nr:hypothetical protein [candidate division Zixibacteria bacterium]
LGGKNYVKTMLEWVAPPIRFRKLGIGAMYLTHARLALFSSGIVTNLDFDLARRYYGNVGAQMDFRITFLSYLRTTVSVGYAVAARKGTRRSDEFMFSVKIL